MRISFNWRAAIAAGVAIALGSCAYNDELGRSQFVFVSGPEMAQLAAPQWAQLKQQAKVSTDPKYVNRLNRVAPKIIRAAGGNPSQWEWQVFDSKDINAFALPGGKIGVYTGIMDLMANDDQLAAVVGHEVGHVKANHSGERYSQNAAASLGLQLGSAALGGNNMSAGEQQLLGALGLGAQYGLLLPFSRKHELEADRLGVLYMSRAGYDPNEAVKFWQTMAAQGGQKPPEFASTHPADETRIKALQREIAMLPSR